MHESKGRMRFVIFRWPSTFNQAAACWRRFLFGGAYEVRSRSLAVFGIPKNSLNFQQNWGFVLQCIWLLVCNPLPPCLCIYPPRHRFSRVPTPRANCLRLTAAHASAGRCQPRHWGPCWPTWALRSPRRSQCSGCCGNSLCKGSEFYWRPPGASTYVYICKYLCIHLYVSIICPLYSCAGVAPRIPPEQKPDVS